MPSDNAEPGGRKTGQSVHHYIESWGPFEGACAALVKNGFTIPWLALTGGDEETRKKRAASKTKYTSPACGVNAWAKLDTALICGACEEPLELEEAA